VRVSPDGKVDSKPLATGLDAPMGLEIAPKGFGSYGGQVFVADMGPTVNIPVPMTQPVAADGKIYRVTSDGRLHLVASGFRNPAGIKFIGNKLWVTDIAGDFIGGKRELPDGFIVEIEAK
jgi:glucose/arabinose dehydrogenase